jgi:small subunit ribosomal protein S1
MEMTSDDTALKQDTFAQLLESGYAYTAPRPREVLRAAIVSVEEDEIAVHLRQTKRDGIVPSTDLDLLDEEVRSELRVGEHVPVRIMKSMDRDGYVVVSINQGLKYSDWLRAEDLVESGETLEAEVTDSNRGGVIVAFGRLRGFVPNSHLARRYRPTAEQKAAMVGETLTLVVLEVNQRRRRLVLSERQARKAQRAELWAELEEGQVRTGVVRNLVDFGAFVDLGGLDGLVHISELDRQYVKHPSQVLDVGDEVEVLVLSVDKERERVGLSRKRLLEAPADQGLAELEEGDLVEGTVTSVKPFGAFVDIGAGVEGLVWAASIPGRPEDSNLEPGMPVTVRVLDVEKGKDKLALEIPDLLSA